MTMNKSPWDDLAAELEEAEGPYCDFEAWEEWIEGFFSRHKWEVEFASFYEKAAFFAAFWQAVEEMAIHPDVLELLQELSLPPHPDSDPASLLETLRVRANDVLKGLEG